MKELMKIVFVVNGRSLPHISWPAATPLTLDHLCDLLVATDEQFRGRKLSFVWEEEREGETLIDSDASLHRATLHAQKNTTTLRLHVIAEAPTAAPASNRFSSSSTSSRSRESERVRVNGKPTVEEQKEDSYGEQEKEEAETRALEDVTVEEVVRILDNLNMPAGCAASVRKHRISGRLLSVVDDLADLRECGLTESVLNDRDAKMLLRIVLGMREEGVSARFLTPRRASIRQPTLQKNDEVTCMLERVQADMLARDTAMNEKIALLQKTIDSQKAKENELSRLLEDRLRSTETAMNERIDRLQVAMDEHAAAKGKQSYQSHNDLQILKSELEQTQRTFASLSDKSQTTTISRPVNIEKIERKSEKCELSQSAASKINLYVDLTEEDSSGEQHYSQPPSKYSRNSDGGRLSTSANDQHSLAEQPSQGFARVTRSSSNGKRPNTMSGSRYNTRGGNKRIKIDEQPAQEHKEDGINAKNKGRNEDEDHLHESDDSSYYLLYSSDGEEDPAPKRGRRGGRLHEARRKRNCRDEDEDEDEDEIASDISSDSESEFDGESESESESANESESVNDNDCQSEIDSESDEVKMKIVRGRRKPSIAFSSESEDDGENEDKIAGGEEQALLPMERCRHVLNRFLNDSLAAEFLNPVDVVEYEDYLEEISEPMCLFDIQKKLNSGEYEKHSDSCREFANDMRKVWLNCMTYNNEESYIWSLASYLSKVFERLYQAWVVSFSNQRLVLSHAEACPWEPSCRVCLGEEDKKKKRTLRCDHCEAKYHAHCLSPPLAAEQQSVWRCARCVRWIEQGGSPVHSVTAEKDAKARLKNIN